MAFKAITTLLCAACLLIAAAVAAAESGNRYRAFTGTYRVYSGELGAQLPPTPGDRKVSVIVKGAIAKELFDSMGADDKETCTAAPGNRSRVKENVWCDYTRSDGYTCYFGFDLGSGKSIPGGIC